MPRSRLAASGRIARERQSPCWRLRRLSGRFGVRFHSFVAASLWHSHSWLCEFGFSCCCSGRLAFQSGAFAVSFGSRAIPVIFPKEQFVHPERSEGSLFFFARVHHQQSESPEA